MKVAESFDQEEHEVVGVKERGGRWWRRSAPPGAAKRRGKWEEAQALALGS